MRQKRTTTAEQPRRLRCELLETRRLLATFTVSEPGDSPVMSAGDAPGTLRQAVYDANSLPGEDLIVFGENLEGVPVMLSHGALTVRESLQVVGRGPSSTTVDAQGSARVFYSHLANQLTVQDLKITGGVADGGAAISMESGDITIQNVVLQGNRADGTSGGGAIRISDGDLLIRDSTISGNESVGVGGAITVVRGTVRVERSVISDNSSASSGGGIYARQGAFPTIDISESTISGNQARSGGAIASVKSAGTRVVSSSIEGNTADISGGAVVLSTTQITFENSTVSGNVASFGTLQLVDFGEITLRSTTITANINAGDRAAINHTPDTFANVVVQNSILAGNQNSSGNPDVNAEFPLLATHSLVGDASGANIPDPSTNLLGTSLSPIDPLLGPLSDNGGPTLTHALLPGSPAINAGDPSAVAGMDGVPQFDQRGAGFARVAGGRIDMGSFEVQDAVTLACDFDGDEICDGIDIDLLQAILVLGPADPSTFDLTGDGLVTVEDRDEWLAVAGAENLPSGNPYRLGDANLDGLVDAQDFVAWNDNRFTSGSAWTKGDFNVDGVVDGPDFVVWNDHKFQSADLETVHKDAASLVRDRCFTELNWGEEEDECTPSRLQADF